jgi:hypothetical protein
MAVDFSRRRCATKQRVSSTIALSRGLIVVGMRGGFFV